MRLPNLISAVMS